MCDRDKILEKVKKVLALSKNNPSEAEAQSAALKAQRMMAEYNITIKELEGKMIDNDISQVEVYVKMGNKWKAPLAFIVSKNFRCKYYFYGRDWIVFFGHKIDAEIAAETFKFLFDFGNRKATNYYLKLKKEGKNTKGVKNAYLVGFLEGINEVFEKQCTALIIVTPKDVEEEYKLLLDSGNYTTRQSKGLSLRIDNEGDKAREEGRITGKNAAGARALECA